MTTETIQCNNCGAPLNIPTSTNYVRCNHCESQLAVKRLADITFTEAVTKLTKSTEELHEKVHALQTKQDLADLEAQWSTEKARFLIHLEDGKTRLPSHSDAVWFGVATVVVGIIWIAFALLVIHSNGAVLLGIVIILFGVLSAFVKHYKADDYQQAYSRHLRRRRQILDKKILHQPDVDEQSSQ